MSKRSVSLLLADIIESGNKIKSYIDGLSYDEFINNSMTIDAVVRNFEIIGEAANQIPEEVRDENDDIDWVRIRGFRNRIVHDYFGIDLEVVWYIIKEYLDPLISIIQKLKDTKFSV